MNLTPESLVSRLGDYLVDRGLLTAENLGKALAYQNEIRLTDQPAPPIGQILIKMGLIERETLDQAITEQIIQLRSALEDSNRQLEQRVKERTAELEQALIRLSELNQLKSNFVSNISHELRTPLTHIKGYIELLITESLGPLQPDQNDALAVMHHSTERLEKLIEDLLLFSMAEREQINLRVRPFDIHAISNTIFSHFSSSKVKLDLECPEKFPLVEGDEEKISWVLLQLLDNAIKFTPNDGKITLRMEQEDNFAIISVEDSGIGFSEEKYDEIFEPFHQLDGSSTRRFGGAGLGLSLVKKIIEAHGSVVRVNSQVGKGSVFSFLLKIAD